MTKQRACLSVVCTETRCVSRANNIAGTECGCLFFFNAFLIRIVASCAKKDFWSSPKDRGLKLATKVSPLRRRRRGDSFFFFFLWNLTNENRSFVFVEKSSINDSVRRKAGRRQCSFSRVFDPVRIFAYYTRNSDAALRCISFFTVNVLCDQRDKIRVCTLIDIYVTFVVFRILRIFSACHGTLLYVKPLSSFDRLNHPNPAFGFRTKIMAGKVPINDCTKSATCVRDALLDIESISRIFQPLVE